MNHDHDWDREYREGKWDALRDADEEVRYAILAGCIVGREYKAPAAVLDLGCGPGVLRDHLSPESIHRYVGVDLSVEAVEQARSRGHERSVYVAAPVETWASDGDYDAIVFNEVLYYLPHPIATVERYVPALASSGSIFVSMWYPSISFSVHRPVQATNVRGRMRHSGIWRALSRRFEVATDIVVKRNGRRQWRIQRLQPLRGSTGGARRGVRASL